MTISLIIPTFNRQATLKRALDSVLQQSLLPDEIIVIDDGSTDASAAMINTEFPQVQYIYQENQGVSAARNKGIRQAKGEWIALLDSDDTWFTEKLERQIKALQQAPEIKLCHTEEKDTRFF
jgi:glycosyltransferase involved in cell wall biosynthesis